MTEFFVSEKWYYFIIAAAACYLVGCFNFAVIISQFKDRDIRKVGSGNPGTMNMMRTFGLKIGIINFFCDALKGGLPVLAVYFVFRNSVFAGTNVVVADVMRYFCGLFVVIGHIFPVTMKFKGGKGILSGGTIAIMIDWRVALVVWGGFLVLAIITKWVSLGSCWAGLSFPFVSWFVYQDVVILLLAIVCGGLILWKHRGNIKRILKGEESKFSFHHKK